MNGEEDLRRCGPSLMWTFVDVDLRRCGPSSMWTFGDVDICRLITTGRHWSTVNKLVDFLGNFHSLIKMVDEIVYCR